MNSKNNDDDDNNHKQNEVVIRYGEQNSVSIAHIAAVLDISVADALEIAYPKEMRTICSGRIPIEDIKDFRNKYLSLQDDLPF